MGVKNSPVRCGRFYTNLPPLLYGADKKDTSVVT